MEIVGGAFTGTESLPIVAVRKIGQNVFIQSCDRLVNLKVTELMNTVR